MNLKSNFQLPNGNYTATIADLAVITNLTGDTSLSSGTFGLDPNFALKAVSKTIPPAPAATLLIQEINPSGRSISTTITNSSGQSQVLTLGTLFPNVKEDDGLVFGVPELPNVVKNSRSLDPDPSYYPGVYDFYSASDSESDTDDGVNFFVKIYNHDPKSPTGMRITVNPTDGSFYYQEDDGTVSSGLQSFNLTLI